MMINLVVKDFVEVLLLLVDIYYVIKLSIVICILVENEVCSNAVKIVSSILYYLVQVEIL